MNNEDVAFEAMLQALAIAGSQVEFARICEVKQPSVSLWIKRKKPLPPKCVLKVEAATGVSRHLLSPDIYPVESPHVAPAWIGVDRGTAHDYFQSSAISQRGGKIGAAA